MSYEYKVMPFIPAVESIEAATTASAHLEAEINEQAVNGWEFHQLGSVSVAVNPGCLAGLFGAKKTSLQLDQLIFRKQKN